MRTTLWITTLAMLAATAAAGPLQRNLVAADAVWVAHLDVDQFKRTEVGQYVLAEMEKPEAQNKLAAFQAIFSFDPRRDIGGLTLYGTGNEPRDGVLIVQGTFDTDRLVTLVKGARDHASSNHRAHVIHEWTDENKERQGRKDAHTVAAVHGGDVILGQARDAVAAALDVMDNVAANLTSTAYFNEFSTTGASFLQGATRKVEVGDGQPHSAMLRQAQYLSLDAGEAAGQMTVRMFAQANSEQVAHSMQQIGQGLIALMSFQTNKPAQAALANATTLQQSGNQLTATLRLPSTGVIEWMQEQEARKAGRD